MALSKGDYIGSYQLTEDFRVAGGRSRISFAQKGGKEWFVKEFLSPKYPLPDSPGSPKTKEYKKKLCQEFENHQNKLMEVTNRACSDGSNLVCGKELIRVGSSYYKITARVDTSTMDPKSVSNLQFKDIMIILRSLTSSVRILHTNNIVHGDLKPENILIKKTGTGVYTSKLIDFDDSYFSGEPSSDRQSVVGTPEYYSPETYQYISDEDEEFPGSALTCAADIYTLGVIFIEYLTGEKPVFDKKKFAYAYAATLSGTVLDIPNHKNVSAEMKSLLNSMLQLDYKKRPTIVEVFNALKAMDMEKVIPAASASVETVSKDEKHIPIAFPKLKLPSALVSKLRDDDKSGKSADAADKPIKVIGKEAEIKSGSIPVASSTKIEDAPKLKMKSAATVEHTTPTEPAKPKLKIRL